MRSSATRSLHQLLVPLLLRLVLSSIELPSKPWIQSHSLLMTVMVPKAVFCDTNLCFQLVTNVLVFQRHFHIAQCRMRRTKIPQMLLMPFIKPLQVLHSHMFLLRKVLAPPPFFQQGVPVSTATRCWPTPCCCVSRAVSSP